LIGIGLAGVVLVGRGDVADFSKAQKLLLTGEYGEAIASARNVLETEPREEAWYAILVRGLLTIGKYPEAFTAMTNALTVVPSDIRLMWLSREAFAFRNDPERGRQVPKEVFQLVNRRSWLYREPESLVVFGQAALALGADPKDVLEKVFDVAGKADSKLRDVYLGRGGLALEKGDFALAAKAFEDGLKADPQDPDFHFGLARAYSGSEDQRAFEEVESALKLNPHHVPSLLLLADHEIDAEEYSMAEKHLEQVQKINPWNPEAWAYRAVLCHLKGDLSGETNARNTGLKFWVSNPGVDHLIGTKLSRKYRFAEGARHQRAALGFDSTFLPAKQQLANDLLRLGEESEGWDLAQEVYQQDGYNVEAYNLVTLHDTLAKYATLTNQDFIVRISTNEAGIYGGQVLKLLDRAKRVLTKKYSVELASPTYVEIFSDQKDFGVRTFGMPDNPGFLGVCFGRVVTATSPAANSGKPLNWETVLWHEFCHVVTLQLTHNKMPRWLSEGISVYEERQADPAWGQRLSPRYREMILDEKELTPIASLSGAFLNPKTPEHLQFAYFQASLVVEFLIERFGAPALRSILGDLGDGVEINRALETRTLPLATLEKDFKEFATAQAHALAPQLEWDKPPADHGIRPNEEEFEDWALKHPKNYWALTETVRRLVDARKWDQAREPLELLVANYPNQVGSESAPVLLAATLRALGKTNEERQILTRYVRLDDSAPSAYLRLMELAAATSDWPEVIRNAERYLAVNPLVAPPWRFLADAAEGVKDDASAKRALLALLRLNPQNPAELHFRLARVLQRMGDPEARKQVLLALEEMPRHRQALELLLELHQKPDSNK
jgi:tetratricopeptide (TPR) repeat protein